MASWDRRSVSCNPTRDVSFVCQQATYVRYVRAWLLDCLAAGRWASQMLAPAGTCQSVALAHNALRYRWQWYLAPLPCKGSCCFLQYKKMGVVILFGVSSTGDSPSGCQRGGEMRMFQGRREVCSGPAREGTQQGHLVLRWWQNRVWRTHN